MGFRQFKTWDDRKTCDKASCIAGRTWVRRLQWLVDEQGRIKFKFNDGTIYCEFIIAGGFAETVWIRFKAGASIEDSVSIFGQQLARHLRSKDA